MIYSSVRILIRQFPTTRRIRITFCGGAIRSLHNNRSRVRIPPVRFYADKTDDKSRTIDPSGQKITPPSAESNKPDLKEKLKLQRAIEKKKAEKQKIQNEKEAAKVDVPPNTILNVNITSKPSPVKVPATATTAVASATEKSAPIAGTAEEPTSSNEKSATANSTDKPAAATLSSVEIKSETHHAHAHLSETSLANLKRLKEKLASIKEVDGYILASKRPRNRDIPSLERNFITPVRAMQDFLLTSHELVGLRKTMRRSPHTDEPPITVYWRKDVEAKAAEVWGNMMEMQSEKMKRDNESTEYREAVFNIKRILKKYREHSRPDYVGPTHDKNPIGNLFTGSGRIVLTAVCINGCNFVIKLLAWWMTGSHSLFAESIHSLADTINQMILAFGIHKSAQRANIEHPYGYANMRHVASLISGVGIFCVGAGLSIYHGIVGLVAMEHIESLYWAFYILGGSLVSEGATLFMAVSSVRKRAKETNMTVREFILRGQDPSLNVVILEDTAAVAGVAVAAICMGLTDYLNSPIPDALGSLVIGGILGSVASFIIYSNSAALVGRSIPREDLNKINAALECDVMIRAIHDVKGIDMGNTMVRYKAEVDFDGRELTRAYMEKLDVPKLLDEVKGMKTPEEFEAFLFRHGENIVDTLGAEIDRIELKLKKEHPEIRHCDLEIL